VGGVPEAVYLTFHREYHKAVKEGVQVEFEEYYPPLRTWFAVRAYPSESGVSVYFQDVNQRRQTEGALRYSEKRFRSLVQYASDIVTVLDADGTVRYQSPSIERILGYEQEEWLVRTSLTMFTQKIENGFGIRLPKRYRTRRESACGSFASATWMTLGGTSKQLATTCSRIPVLVVW
jgi:PAS domain-containing protein